MVPDVHNELLECKEQLGRQDPRRVYGAEDRPHKQHKTTDSGWKCPAQHTRASCCNETWSLHLPKGACSQAALSPTLTSQPFPAIPNLVPSSQPPQLRFQKDRGQNPPILNKKRKRHWLTGMLLQSPGSTSSSAKKNKIKNKKTHPHTLLTVSVTAANASLFYKGCRLTSAAVLCSSAHSRL